MVKTLEEYIEKFREEENLFLQRMGFIPDIRCRDRRIQFNVGKVECSIDFKTDDDKVYGRFYLRYNGETIERKNEIGHDGQFRDRKDVLEELFGYMRSLDSK